MEITDVKAHIFTPLKLVDRDVEPFSLIDWSRLSWGMRDSAIVSITTDTGIEGYAAASPETAEYLVAHKEESVGADPFDRLKVAASFGRSEHAVTTLDIGLWDIAGKALKLPVYKLLGAFRDKMPAYASFIQLPAEKDYVNLALQCKERGYRAIKLHPYWGGDWRRDIALCRAVREAV